MIIIPLAILIFFTATKVVKPDGGIALTFQQDGLYRVICFLFGAAFSGLTGFIGMSIAVRGNVRTAAAASKGGGMAAALRVAFRTGAVTGMLCVGLGLVGATAIVLIFQNSATAVLIGFAFGASLIALFMRVGGGIFTKAADVGADLVGKVEAGIPEDDPRNAATIADNVGDNVGDCAGMAADLFESYEITIISSLILGYSAFSSIRHNPTPAVLYPLIVPAIGIFASVIGVLVVRARKSDRNALAPINRGFWLAALLTVVGAFLVAQYYVHDLKVFYAVLTGVILSLVASQITEQFTSTERGPVKEIAASARTGPATTVLSGFSIGLESSVWAIIAIAIAIGVAIGLGDGNIELTFYLVALIGIGLLATAGMVVSEDSFGPVSDNAAGIAEMSGEFTGEAERVMVSLDAVGNTTKAITKGVAIGSAVIAAVALFAVVHRDDRRPAPEPARYGPTSCSLAADPDQRGQPDDLHRTAHRRLDRLPLLVAGHPGRRPLGRHGRARGAAPVPRAPGHHGLHREARIRAGHLASAPRPPSASWPRRRCWPSWPRSSSGFGINYLALGAFLAGTILTGQLMANTLSNSGGAWDNAKKYIEDGNEGGKGSEAHKAAVIGDTVGDPFKDTAGPALNPMIKVMNLVSLLILPAVISLRHDTGARLAIAGVSLVVLLAALAFSKRGTEAMDAEDTADRDPAQRGRRCGRLTCSAS